ncbi:hypothetical protein GCM10022199_02890 [Marihabitans asiaticum]|uniref:Uncharacterized protein n=1 Tax=Marihabitans asiaticum TaxID=415218 RepID=A0A560WEH7_9MICO|nr:hypothetical protein [Marihabitans asiaticum]TWD16037.1 hypothetical protein FB557_1578 [Marihabitans asiaticum]
MSEDLDPESPGGLGPGVDPEDLATTLRVLGTLHELPAGHPDIAAVKRASGTMYNRVRKAARRAARRAERDPMIARDEAILAFSGAVHAVTA